MIIDLSHLKINLVIDALIKKRKFVFRQRKFFTQATHKVVKLQIMIDYQKV